ncbi:MAG: FeoA family protein [Lachnospiraceae bacterium]|nr:FeoA family protein [Lachnospiraceae bacterium]
MMPLSMASSGEKVVIKQINGKDETKRFLENLGFVTGGYVVIISEMCGNIIVNVKDTRVAISKSMASRIMVN